MTQLCKIYWVLILQKLLMFSDPLKEVAYEAVKDQLGRN